MPRRRAPRVSAYPQASARHPQPDKRRTLSRWCRPLHTTGAAISIVALATFLSIAAEAHEDPALKEDEISEQIALHPNDATLYLQRAEERRSQRQWAEGVEDLQTASRLDPSLVVVDLALAKLLLSADNPQPALAAVDRFLAHDGNHAGGRLTRARILVKLGSRREAVDEFTRGIELARGGADERSGAQDSRGAQPDDYLERARVLACEGEARIDEAIRGLDEGAAALGGAITLQMLAVDLEVDLRRWDAALQRLAALETKANRKEAWIARRADVLLLAGRNEEAGRVYASALAVIDALPERLRTTTTTSALAAQIRTTLSDLKKGTQPTTFIRARLTDRADCPTAASPM